MWAVGMAPDLWSLVPSEQRLVGIDYSRRKGYHMVFISDSWPSLFRAGAEITYLDPGACH